MWQHEKTPSHTQTNLIYFFGLYPEVEEKKKKTLDLKIAFAEASQIF